MAEVFIESRHASAGSRASRYENQFLRLRQSAVQFLTLGLATYPRVVGEHYRPLNPTIRRFSLGKWELFIRFTELLHTRSPLVLKLCCDIRFDAVGSAPHLLSRPQAPALKSGAAGSFGPQLLSLCPKSKHPL